jgi:hypothetical protein
MNSQRSSAPANGRAESLWIVLRPLIYALRTPTPSPVPVVATRTVRRRR